MAYDKIIPVRARLDHCADYVLNPEKTSLPDGGPRLATAINCQLDTAYRDMMDTKRRWGKSGGVQGYHIIHSYTPGEVTPMEAHEMGVELAQRLLGDKYEAIVSTHLDHDHLHCHILFNSVGFMDGAKFRNTFQDYYRDIRGISNEVSRAHGVSVIEPEAKGEHYAEWSAGQSGKATVRGLIRQDMDAAINSAFTYQTFWEQLARMGYTIKRGPNVKHTAVRPPGGARFIRLASLGDGYTEDAIKERLAGVRSGISTAQSPPPKPPRRYTVKRGPLPRRPRQKLKGFRALYVHYLYLLGIRRPSPKCPPLPFSVRKGGHTAEPLCSAIPLFAGQPHRHRRPTHHAGRCAASGDRRPDGPAGRPVPSQTAGAGRGRRDTIHQRNIASLTSKVENLRPDRTGHSTHPGAGAALPDARRKEQEHQKAIIKTRQARPQKFSPPDR